MLVALRRVIMSLCNLVYYNLFDGFCILWLIFNFCYFLKYTVSFSYLPAHSSILRRHVVFSRLNFT